MIIKVRSHSLYREGSVHESLNLVSLGSIILYSISIFVTPTRERLAMGYFVEHFRE